MLSIVGFTQRQCVEAAGPGLSHQPTLSTEFVLVVLLFNLIFKSEFYLLLKKIEDKKIV